MPAVSIAFILSYAKPVSESSRKCGDTRKHETHEVRKDLASVIEEDEEEVEESDTKSYEYLRHTR